MGLFDRERLLCTCNKWVQIGSQILIDLSLVSFLFNLNTTVNLYLCRLIPVLLFYSILDENPILSATNKKFYKMQFFLFASHIGFLQIGNLLVDRWIGIPLSGGAAVGIRLINALATVGFSYVVYCFLGNICPRLLRVITGSRA